MVSPVESTQERFMRTKKKLHLVLAIVLALLLALTSCTDSANSRATVFVQGKGGSDVDAPPARSSGNGLVSGDVLVNGTDITDQLVPSNENVTDPGTGSEPGQPQDTGTPGSNDALFEAEIIDVPARITLSVEPREGFVFNEWRLNNYKVRQDRLSWHEYLDLLLTNDERYAESLNVDADKAKYYIATFERGYYINLEATEKGSGIKSSPFNSFTEAITALGTNGSIGRFDDEEITFKVSGSNDTQTLNLSDMADIIQPSKWSDDDIELELRVLGGYNEKWEKVGQSKFNIDFSVLKDEGAVEIDEVEIASVNMEELDYSTLGELETDDLMLFNVSVDTVTLGNGGVIANLVINGTAPDNAVYVNCVVPEATSGSTYVHSMIKSIPDDVTIKGVNNIILSGTGEPQVSTDGWNITLAQDTAVKGYMLESLPDAVLTARVLDDDWLEEGDDDDNKGNPGLNLNVDIDDDYLEHDIAGRERRDDDDGRWRKLTASFGPYEYLDIQRWERDWDDDLDDWDD